MPIATADRGKILRYLGLSIKDKPQIDLLCNAVEQESEQLAQQVLDLINQLDGNATQIAKASEGKVKLDVIEWKPDRKCDLYSHKRVLVRELANAIGYELKPVRPW